MQRSHHENRYIREFEDGKVIVDRGPMLMSISASKAGAPIIPVALRGAKKALKVLDALTKFRDVIIKRVSDIASVNHLPPVVRKMIRAAREFDDLTVTPLISAAGAGADEVADFLYGVSEASKILANNGGDIAIRLRDGESARVGIKTDLTEKGITHTLTVTRKSGIGGVATSGFGGRSFTRGVANAAVAVARNAILADVAATLIGNATNVESPRVARAPARSLFQSTDIPNLLVTTKVGDLETWEVEQALDRGMRQADVFEKRDLIIGAVVAVKNRIRISQSLARLIESVSDIVAV